MEHLCVQLDAICEQAAKKELGYREFLTEALQTEWSGRHQRGVQCRLQMARFPWVKSIEQFDFAFQPSIDRKVVRELSASGFVDRAENVIILGLRVWERLIWPSVWVSRLLRPATRCCLSAWNP